MSNISFETGVKEYTINNDPDRVLRINMADENILPNLKASFDRCKEQIKKMGKENPTPEETLAEISEIDNYIRSEFDRVLYPGASETVFGNMNLMTLTDSGTTVYENFMRVFIDLISSDMKKKYEKSMKNVEKYRQEIAKQKEAFADHVRTVTESGKH